jgi:hypothetical protein
MISLLYLQPKAHQILVAYSLRPSTRNVAPRVESLARSSPAEGPTVPLILRVSKYMDVANSSTHSSVAYGVVVSLRDWPDSCSAEIRRGLL